MKCPKCGYQNKNYCCCKKLTVWDLEPIDGKDYCRRCGKKIDRIKARL